MKYDREEAYLHEKLTGGLHPAGVDLWPAVAEHLPDAPPARHPRWKLAICLAAPLLIAARVHEPARKPAPVLCAGGQHRVRHHV